MNVINSIEELERLAQIILTEDKNPGKLRSTCYELYDFFCKIAEFSDSDDNKNIKNDTILLTGKAISPVNAARCLWDYKRTSEFLRGVLAAIFTLQNRFPDEKIEILYAGCGPFAPLIVLLLSKFSPDEINLTLIDYHHFSISAAKKIFKRLNLEKFNPDFIQTDAVKYKHPRKLHLVICETMQSSLASEPQTAITLNLAPQLCQNGIFVPQKIAIEVCLTNFGKEFSQRERINLGKILELDAEQIRQNCPSDFPKVSIKTPNKTKNKNLQLMILTKIKIYDSFQLNDYDSGISYPQLLHSLPQIEAGQTIEFSYILTDKPHFEYRVAAD